MAVPRKMDPEDIEEAANWLRNQKETLRQGLLEADTKMADVVAAAYSAPGSETRFRPYWNEYNTGTRDALQGLEGVSRFLSSVARAFVDTDDQTAGSIG
ncbi:WXG100 family type VII secretion target [Streptomyces luteolifulvus]|uniref:WXG100 family type VII secretion target n=1 Tax=Streptomyces luteolifulvus TaxID=2615112 RepID=A0A6H9URI3_9ACTN|nr:WXG100 family type VII secretion target [Streptomyces luteolifulvus]KAB1140843.1 WXG100 family type VII secretion target [Streptomyces luteolifulvus]